MKQNLEPIAVKRKTGNEHFHENGNLKNFTLQDFWSWSNSDLVMNIARGIVAEFIVAKALDAADEVRIEWDKLDVSTPEGITVEVKSSAYLQSWEQTKFSTIQFDIEKTTPLNEEKGGYGGKERRAADVYVFALLKEKDKSKVDPLDLEQWRFFVVPTRLLNERERSQQSITLPSLEKEKVELQVQEVAFSGLKEAVAKACPEKSGVK